MKNLFAVAFIRDKKILFLKEGETHTLPLGESTEDESPQQCIYRTLSSLGILMQEENISQTEVCGIMVFGTDEHIHLYIGNSRFFKEKELAGVRWLTRLEALQMPGIPQWIVMAIGELRVRGLV